MTPGTGAGHCDRSSWGDIIVGSAPWQAVLPTLFGSLMALVTFLMHRFVGLPLQRLVGWRTRAEPGGLQ